MFFNLKSIANGEMYSTVNSWELLIKKYLRFISDLSHTHTKKILLVLVIFLFSAFFYNAL